MTRKGYELIARAVRNATNDAIRHAQGDLQTERRVACAYIVDELARELAETNPRFDATRFRAACEAE